MLRWKRTALWIIAAIAVCSQERAMPAALPEEAKMPSLIEQFSADHMSFDTYLPAGDRASETP